MNDRNNESRRISIAGIALCGMVIFLTVFTLLVYKDKRKEDDDLIDDFNTGLISEDSNVSESDAQTPSQTEVSSDVASAVSSSADSQTAKNEYVMSPDYKSDYYMVVFVESQSIVVYKKSKSGEYTIKFHEMICSTGNQESTPTREGVYTLTKKERWSALADSRFGQYGCQITGSDNYVISSTPFSKKKAWTMVDGEYENLGKACTKGNIQLCVRDAYWIYNNINTGTQIHVVNSKNPDAKELTLPKRKSYNGGWDPTDKWSKGNPYFD